MNNDNKKSTIMVLSSLALLMMLIIFFNATSLDNNEPKLKLIHKLDKENMVIILGAETNLNSKCRFDVNNNKNNYWLMKEKFITDDSERRHLATHDIVAGETYYFYISCRSLSGKIKYNHTRISVPIKEVKTIR